MFSQNLPVVHGDPNDRLPELDGPLDNRCTVIKRPARISAELTLSPTLHSHCIRSAGEATAVYPLKVWGGISHSDSSNANGHTYEENWKLLTAGQLGRANDIEVEA